MLLCLFLVECGGFPSALGLANVQAGKTNTQTLGMTELREQTLVRPQAQSIYQTADKNRVRAEAVETVVVHEGIKPWHVMAFIAWTWFWYEMPAPRHIRKWISERWQKKKARS
ncbi:hypothetical protein MHM88_14285 [Epibacterium sp. MM17-32]|uniref:hypothetical protein n=1 Tax=Epibacterium sp. MM17-32 TaxID=2917734 RepID=UPI001EF49FFE|nr:hypothetical protein [Epibacterium sp. MM17-32]MCG7628976.1 hypothetical protein [Epibacterium sp. MM17-32]